MVTPVASTGMSSFHISRRPSPIETRVMWPGSSARLPMMKEFQELRGPEPPTPGTPGQLQRAAEVGCTTVWFPNSGGGVPPDLGFEFRGPGCESPRLSGLADARDDPDGHEEVCGHPGPHASRLCDPHVQENWTRKSTDTAVQGAARAYYTAVDALAEKRLKVMCQPRV
jgi:hypothetical protein